jgi:hypothetical protein
VIATEANASGDDEFAHAQREQRGEVIIVTVAATLTNAIHGLACWLVEIQRELVAFGE